MTLYLQPRHVSRDHHRQEHIEYSEKASKTISHSSPFNRLLKYTTIGLVAFGTINGALSYYSYRKSLNWSTNRDSLKMADMPVDTLTDTGKQAEYKQRFVLLANTAVDKDGNLHADAKDMRNLRNALAKIKTARPIYKAKYQRVEQKYRIRKKVGSLFSKHNTLKETSTPYKVYQTLADIAPDLNNIYNRNHHDGFVKHELIVIQNLVHDTRIWADFLNELNKNMILKKGVITPSASLTPSRYAKFYDKLQRLHYRWNCLDHFETLQDAINNVLQEQNNKIMAYNDWQNDLKAKADAYKNLAKMRRKHRKHYYDEKARKAREKEKERREAEAEKQREAEEQTKAEAEQKEEERRQHEADEQAGQESSGNNSNNSSNNTSNGTSSYTSSHNEPTRHSSSTSSHVNQSSSSSSSQSSGSSSKTKKTPPEEAVNADDNTVSDNDN